MDVNLDEKELTQLILSLRQHVFAFSTGKDLRKRLLQYLPGTWEVQRWGGLLNRPPRVLRKFKDYASARAYFDKQMDTVRRGSLAIQYIPENKDAGVFTADLYRLA